MSNRALIRCASTASSVALALTLWLGCTAAAQAAPTVPQPKPALATPEPKPQSATSPAAKPQSSKPQAASVQPKPPRPEAQLTALPVPAQDLSILEAALTALDKKNWPTARSALDLLADPLAKDYLLWHLVVEGKVELPFETIVRFLDANPDWPRMIDMIAGAERAMDARLTSDQVVAWFAGREPITGEGKIRLGAALLEQGETEYGIAWIRRAWVEHDFKTSEQDRIVANFNSVLGAEAHQKRLLRLLWERKYDDAQRMQSLVDADHRELVKARMQIVRGKIDPTADLKTLPRALQKDPGIWFDRVYAARKQGEDREAWALLVQLPKTFKDIGDPNDWWVEQNFQARKAHREREFKTAYEIASGHGGDRGVSFAEAEFFSGWLALRYLDEPIKAQKHFETLTQGVSSPISRARGLYWTGRAAEAKGDRAAAVTAYGAAAAIPQVFYGQLAAANAMIGARSLTFKDTSPARDHLKAEFLQRRAVRALKLANTLGDTSTTRRFVLHLAASYTTPEDLALLADTVRSLGQTHLAVRVGKEALSHDVFLTSVAYPAPPLPDYRGAGAAPEAALIYALTRQESEFNAGAVSHAGARGLMQLMPATAKLTAKLHGLSYDKTKLTKDPDYNTQLGMAHVADLLETFDGSYIMTIAAYNAGPGRARQWANEYGDPRLPNVDPIDWIESIPFEETRNYVQRVMENLQVYRALLRGSAQPLEITADLKRFVPTGAPRPPELDEGTLGGDQALHQSPAAPDGTGGVMAPIVD